LARFFVVKPKSEEKVMTKKNQENQEENKETKETTTEVTIFNQGAAPTLTLPGGVVVRKVQDISLPTLSTEGNAGLTLAVRFMGEMVGKESVAKDGEVKDKPTIVYSARVIDLTTGGLYNMVCAAVIKSELEGAYPNHGYVGKSFLINKGEKPKGKRYHAWTITEIEVEPAA
jgi:hypothetical protein